MPGEDGIEVVTSDRFEAMVADVDVDDKAGGAATDGTPDPATSFDRDVSPHAENMVRPQAKTAMDPKLDSPVWRPTRAECPLRRVSASTIVSAEPRIHG